MLKHLNKIIYGLLFASLALLLYQYWGIAFTGGDDPFIALDAIRKGGIWEASIKQAIGQGRFYYVLPWFLTQLAYIGDSFAWTNTVKITTDIVFMLCFFGLLKSIWSETFALICSFIGLAIFQWYGSDFNPFHNVPLWYALGGIFLLISFWIYNEDLKKKKTRHWIAFAFFFLGLLFYEIFLFYGIVFSSLYLFHNKKGFKVINLIKDHFGLLVYFAIYLIAYLIFREYYPSGYEGSKELNYTTFFRTIKTINSFAWTGIWPNIRLSGLQNLPLAVFISTLVLSGLMFSFKKAKEDSELNAPSLSLLNLSALIFLIYCPNFLYGFVDKYHSWADGSGYYLGSFFSAFPLIILVTAVIIKIWPRLTVNQNKNWKLAFLILPLFIISTTNYSRFITSFNVFKIDYHKWELIQNVAAQVQDKLQSPTTICTNSFYAYQDSYYIYDYWSLYLSNRLGKEIKVKWKPQLDSECQWVINFGVEDAKAKIILHDLKNKASFYKEISL